ncbi:MAG: EamA family transporter [Cyanobacteriota bacterium]|nr:EamA family transporter [Cyanobacteriota bacterium]
MAELWNQWSVWAVAAAVLAALTSLLAKLGLQGLPSNLATLLRTLVVVAFLGAVVLLRGEWLPLSAMPRRSLLFLFLSGLATAGSWLCFFRALQMGPVARVAPIDKFSVVLVAIGGVALLGETLSPIQWVGVVSIAVGAALLAWS